MCCQVMADHKVIAFSIKHSDSGVKVIFIDMKKCLLQDWILFRRKRRKRDATLCLNTDCTDNADSHRYLIEKISKLSDFGSIRANRCNL